MQSNSGPHLPPLLLGLLLLASAWQSSAEAAGPTAQTCQQMLVLRVIDGDTVYGYIDTSDPIVAIRAKLRLEGIDAPERGYRARCPAEAAKADQAKAFLQQILTRAIKSRGRSLARACHLRQGKYALRRLGRLEIRIARKWIDVSALLLKNGFAIPSKGRRDRAAWCKCPKHGDCPAGYPRSPSPAAMAWIPIR